MIRDEDRVCLRRIRDGACASRGVGPANHGMIAASAARFNHRPEVIAGILMRESRGGEILDEDGLGDGGHGHGLMQIDDRSFSAFCNGERWREPEANVEFGSSVLYMKRSFLASRCDLEGADLERAAIAAYNCGEGRVLQSVLEGEIVDTHTSGHDYSKAVLEYAEAYAELVPESAVQPVPALATPEPQMRDGFWSRLLDGLLRLFVKRASP